MKIKLPFGAKPYFWISQEIDVTPGTRKSNGLTVKSHRSIIDKIKPPRVASTCKGIPYRWLS